MTAAPPPWATTRRLGLALLIAIPFVILWLKPLAVLLSRNYFAYTNAWDEETYLSFQGAWATRAWPGYWAGANLVVLLHHAGLSGAMQNVMFDVLAPVAVFAAASAALARFAVPRHHIYALLIVFGPVIFNNNNPYLIANFWPTPPGWAVAAESYEPYLRSPHIALAYLEAAAAVATWLRWRVRWPLLIPIIGTHWSFAIPWTCLLATAALRMWLRRRPWWADRPILTAITSASAPVLAAGLGLTIAVPIFFRFDPVLGNSQFANPCSDPLVSINLLVAVACLGMFLAAHAALRERPGEPQLATLMAIGAVQLLTPNLQVFTGVCLRPHALQDTLGTFLSAVACVVTLIAIFDVVRRRSILVASWLQRVVVPGLTLLVVLMVARSEGFNLQQRAFRFSVIGQISPGDVARYHADPVHALFLDELVGARINLSRARILSPPLIYQYAGYRYTDSRWLATTLQEEAIAHAERVIATDPRAQSWVPHLLKRIKTYHDYRATWPADLAYLRERSRLQEENRSGELYVIEDSDANPWLWWPDWSQPTWRQRLAFRR